MNKLSFLKLFLSGLLMIGKSVKTNTVFLAIIALLLSSCGGGSTGSNGSDLHKVNGTIFGPDTFEQTSKISSKSLENFKTGKSALKPAKKDSGQENADIPNSDHRLTNQRSPYNAGSISVDSLDGESSIANAQVHVYDLVEYTSGPENVQPLASATTNANGAYSVSKIPAGIDILIMVETDPHLSSVQFGVDDKTTGDVNSATTLATERWAPELLKGNSVSGEDFMGTVELAEQLLSGTGTQELAYILGELIPQEFGDGFPGNLPPSLQSIANQLNGIDMSVCEDLELSRNIAAPASMVDLSGLTDDFGEEPGAWIYDAEIEVSEEDSARTYVERTNSEEGKILIPFYPSNWRAGGNVKVVFFSQDQSIICPAKEIEVEALEPAPGTTKQFLLELENSFVEDANILGYDPAVLYEAELSELDPQIRALAAGLQIINGPDYPNNLRNFLSGDAPALEEEIDQELIELMDAVLAKMGTINNLGKTRNSFKDVASLQKNGKLGYSSADIEADFSISPSGLDFLMNRQEEIAFQVEGILGELQTGVATVTGVLAFATAISGVGSAAAPALGAISTAQSVRILQLEAGKSLLPSTLPGIELSTSPALYEEDLATEGEWNAQLFARSEGWTLTWPDVLGSIPFVGDKVGAVFKNLGRGSEEIAAATVDHLQRHYTSVWNVTADSGPIEIDPRNWAVEIDPNSEDASTYFTWELTTLQSETGGPPFMLINEGKQYAPQEVGESELEVRTRGGEVFQGLNALSTRILKVLPIEVTMRRSNGDTSPFIAEPGEQIELIAEVENANDPTVEWSSNEGSFTGFFTGEEIQKATYIVPDDQGNYVVRATSIAKTGARSDGQPVREATGIVTVGDLDVSPNPPCIMTGETIEFTGYIAGEEIEFSTAQVVSGPGSVSPQGVYSSSAEGEVTIKFSYQQQGNSTARTAFVDFEVKEFCSYFKVETDKFAYTTNCPSATIDSNGGGGISFGKEFAPKFVGGISAPYTWINEDGEWTKEISGIENFQIRFDIADYQPNGDPFVFIGPSYDPDTGNPIGNQTLTIEKDVTVIGGQEVVLFSGSMYNIAFNGSAEKSEARATGFIKFKGVPDVVSVYSNWLDEWTCIEQ